jgi:hypothetical protein
VAGAAAFLRSPIAHHRRTPHDAGGQRIAALSFDVADSDLPLRVAFPLLMANTIHWLAGETAEPSRVSLPERQSRLSLRFACNHAAHRSSDETAKSASSRPAFSNRCAMAFTFKNDRMMRVGSR